MISIIIPTRNEEKLIRETLSSLKTLDMDKKIIITDDRSTDKTVEIAGAFADIVLLNKNGEDRTISRNRNVGAKEAEGEFLVFFDVDSKLIDPNDFFHKALENFDKDKNLVALTGAMVVLPSVATWRDNVVYGILNFNIRILNNVLGIGEAVGKFQMIKKHAFDQIGGFREDLATREDGDIFKRLSKIGKTKYDSKLVIYHRARRAHREGWPHLLWTWGINTIWFTLFDKTVSTKWAEVR